MDPRQLFADERLTGMCVYCGRLPNTRDHVPSRILLDDPLPKNLQVVDACDVCNQSFSLDEEYLACFLECTLAGSTDPSQLRRNKIKRALSRNTRLSSRIQDSARIVNHDVLVWEPEYQRVQHIVVKLARGHAAYELSLPQLYQPDTIAVAPLLAMTKGQRENFGETELGELRFWPEIGSRAFIRAAGAKPYSDQVGPWIVVQPGQYRYAVHEFGGVSVKMVLAEYLACVVEWA